MSPILYEDKEKKKALGLQFDRCKGCGICIEICPRKILAEGKKLNTRVQYPPELVEGGICTFCRECELICPDFAMYTLEVAET